ncbi:MAG: 4-hydroxy-tetrahydrodipicolinate reductase [Acidobacteria bacterium]|nr:4-hydroxy-tetrahydrodipicolinate reductase [Acidobacteriota bacterium]
MNLALIGYGKMGRLIEQAALARGHRVAFTTDVEGNEKGQALTAENLKNVDVTIDFTAPEVVVQNIDRVTALGVNMVVGTTGWMSQLPKVRALVQERAVGFVYSSNFSIGVNLFFRLIEAAAAQFRNYPEYDPWIYEIHHRAKVDAPSGTALRLKQILEKAYGGREFLPASNRAGAHPGTHTVGFDSESDTLTFTHTARSRLGFAAGALHAAEWVCGRQGFYEFSEIFPS